MAENIIEEWLKSLNLPQYAESFLDNGYDDLEICKQIGEPDLDAIGVLNSAHRTEILCAVKNLREQGGAAVYFTLEGPDSVDRNGDDAKHEDLATPPSSVHSSPRKYKTMDAYEEGKMELVKIPRLQLKLMIRDKLLEDGIHLGSHPYTNTIKVSSPGPCNGAEGKGKDGSPGYIDALALRYAGELNTHYHDVLDRLEELRKRRVSQEIESLSTKSADSSPRSPLPHQQRFGPGIHAKQSPNAYYGEVPHAIYGFYGIYGLADMKNKDSPKRGQSPRSQSFDAGIYATEHHEVEPKKKVGGLGKLFRGVSRKKDRSPKHSKSNYKSIEADINACDTPMSDEDRMKLMMMVREGHISMAEAVEKVKVRFYEAGKKTEKELEQIEAQDGSGSGGSKAGFFKMPSFRKKKQDKFEDQRHSFFSSHEYFGNEGTKHASHFYDDPPYESDDSDKANTFSPEIIRRYQDGTEIVNGDFSKYGCLKRQRRNGKNSNYDRSPGDIDDIIQEKQEITGSNGISYTPGIYGCYKGDYIDSGSRSDNYGEVMTSIERPKTGVLDKFKNFTKSGSISEEGLSHSSDYEDQDEFDRKMERRLSRDLSGRANAIMGRMKGIKKDVKRRISRLRTTKTGTDIEATDPSTQDSVLRSGSSVESLPSGSGSASGSSIQPPTTSSSNRSSSSVEEDPNIYSGPFIGKARALVDYTPSPYDRDALKLKKGDVIDIISMNQSGTWAGRLNNKVGSFKFINVEVIPETNVRQRRSRYPRRRNSKRSKPKTVEELLTRISLEEYISVFLLNGYENLDLFKEIEEEDLDDLGINDAEHRAKILTAAELLQDYDAPDSPINESIPSSISSNLDPSSSQSDTSKLSGDTVLTPKQYQSPRDSGCYASNENLLHKEKHNSKIEICEAEISQSESGFAVSADSEDLSISPRHSEDWSTTDKENVSMNNLANQQQVGKESKKKNKDHCKSEETQTELSVVRTLYNAQQKVNFCTGDTNDSSPKLNSSSSKTVVIHRSSSQSSGGSETTKSPLPGVKPKVKNSSIRKLSSSSTESWEHKESSTESSADASKPVNAITDNLGTSYKKQVVIEDGLISKTPPPIPKRPGKHHKQKDSPSPDKKLTSDSLPGSPRVKSATIPRPQLQKCPTVPHSQSHHSNVKTLAGNFQDAANQKSPQKQNNLKTKRTPRPVSVTLESLLFRKLQDEMIDLSKEPYTDRTGFCGIPPALVQRYAEEMKRDIREVAEALDQVRIMTLQEQGKQGVPNDFLADSCQSPVLEFNHFSLNDWLVSLGLPMYSELLVRSGFSQLEQISQMNEANFKTCGVNDPRHLRRLLNGVEELCFYLEKFHC